MRYSSFNYPIQRINDKLYQVIAEYRFESVLDVNGIKEWLNCDVAFKSNHTSSYLFCRTIEDIESEPVTT
jgi:hypothetical protein